MPRAKKLRKLQRAIILFTVICCAGWIRLANAGKDSSPLRPVDSKDSELEEPVKLKDTAQAEAQHVEIDRQQAVVAAHLKKGREADKALVESRRAYAREHRDEIIARSKIDGQESRTKNDNWLAEIRGRAAARRATLPASQKDVAPPSFNEGDGEETVTLGRPSKD